MNLFHKTSEPVVQTNLFGAFKDENQIAFHMEQVFQDYSNACNAYEISLVSHAGSSEVYLANELLDRIQTVSLSMIRLENNQTEIARLKLRCEGFMGKIWEKIAAFWGWLVNKIKSLFSAPVKEASDEVRKKAATVIAQAEKVQPKITFQKLHGIEKIVGTGDFKALQERLKEISSQYGYVQDFAKMVVEDVTKFLSSALFASLIPQAFLSVSGDFLVANGSTDFSQGQKERLYYVGCGKAFRVTKEVLPYRVEITPTTPDIKEGGEISLTHKELNNLLKIIPEINKKMSAVNKYFNEEFVKHAPRIEALINEVQKEVNEASSSILKNRLQILKTFNEFGMIALRLSKEYYNTGEKIKQVEIDILSKILKPGTFKSAEQVEKDLVDPNVKTIVL